MRRFLPLLPVVLISACASPQPKPPAGASRITAQKPPAPQAPRWQAVPAKADGVAVPGCKYDERAATRAYRMMGSFFSERFKEAD